MRAPLKENSGSRSRGGVLLMPRTPGVRVRLRCYVAYVSDSETKIRRGLVCRLYRVTFIAHLMLINCNRMHVTYLLLDSITHRQCGN